MSLPSGARFAQGEFERIAEAVAKLEKDSHAPRQIYVAVNLHFHHEYPRLVYKGQKPMAVNSEGELKIAIEHGYSKDVPAPPSEDEEA